MKNIFLGWKRAWIKLQIDKLLLQAWHSPQVWSRIAELDYQLKSLDEYLGNNKKKK